MGNSGVVVGVDIGGTKIRAAVVKRGGKVGKVVEVPTGAKEGRSVVISALFRAISAVSPKKPGAIGVGIAGLVDHKGGVFKHGPNFSKDFSGIPLAGLIKKEFGARTVIDNDVHCFTLAEAKFGSAKRISRVIGLAFGTGIGGSVVVGGKIVRGAHNSVGEFGHTTIVAEDGAACNCGQAGHFEAYASGTAMQNLYAAQSGKKLAATEIEELAKNGDLTARRVIKQMAKMVAIGIANLAQAYDPDMIVIGGGLSRADILFAPAIAMVSEFIAYPELQHIPVVRTALGQNASVIGAALITEKL